jgi:hypothetical protein
MHQSDWDKELQQIEAKIAHFESMFSINIEHNDQVLVKALMQLENNSKETFELIEKLISLSERKNLISGRGRYILHWAGELGRQLQSYIELFLRCANKQMWLNLIRFKFENTGLNDDFRIDERNIHSTLQHIKNLKDSIAHSHAQFDQIEYQHTKALVNQANHMAVSNLGVLHSQTSSNRDGLSPAQLYLPRTSNPIEDLNYLLRNIALPIHKGPMLNRVQALQSDYIDKAEEIIELYESINSEEKTEKKRAYSQSHKKTKTTPSQIIALIQMFKELELIKEKIFSAWKDASQLQIPLPRPKFKKNRAVSVN